LAEMFQQAFGATYGGARRTSARQETTAEPEITRQP